MMDRGKVILTALLLGVALLLTVGSAEAGVVYTDETAFNNAVAGLGFTSLWSEDFQNFATGGVSNPLLIGGGMAEITGGTNAFIADLQPSGNAWSQGVGSFSNATIQGPGATGLDLPAFSFNFGSQTPRTVSFVTTAGADMSPSYSAGSTNTTFFVGWVSSGPETVLAAQFDLPEDVSLDNVQGIGVPNPEPSTFLLFGLGAAGLYFVRRRRKSRPAN